MSNPRCTKALPSTSDPAINFDRKEEIPYGISSDALRSNRKRIGKNAKFEFCPAPLDVLGHTHFLSVRGLVPGRAPTQARRAQRTIAVYCVLVLAHCRFHRTPPLLLEERMGLPLRSRVSGYPLC